MRIKNEFSTNCNGMNTVAAAQYLGVSEALLRKLRQNNEGPNYCKIGTKVVYRRKDLDAYLDRCLVYGVEK